jgi:hypothetical protein
MSSNSDPLFNQYAELDFSDAKPVSEIPALAALQAQTSISQLTRLTLFRAFRSRLSKNRAQLRSLHVAN